MIGFRIGDLHVKKNNKNSKIVCINTNTTKLAQVNLIKEVFGCYGHFYTKNRNGVYDVTCLLDNSFSFLLHKQDKIEDWILNDKTFFFSFLAGYTDAEGCIKINNGMASYRLGSYDKNLLKQAYKKLKGMDLHPNYNLETKKGEIFGGVRQNGDFWRIGIYRKDALLKLFEFLGPYLKHSSRVEDLKVAKENILERNRRKDERKKANYERAPVY